MEPNIEPSFKPPRLIAWELKLVATYQACIAEVPLPQKFLKEN
jgi:hypothetical protein